MLKFKTFKIIVKYRVTSNVNITCSQCLRVYPHVYGCIYKTNYLKIYIKYILI